MATRHPGWPNDQETNNFMPEHVRRNVGRARASTTTEKDASPRRLTSEERRANLLWIMTDHPELDEP